jgi:hypothetical protein
VLKRAKIACIKGKKVENNQAQGQKVLKRAKIECIKGEKVEKG